MNNTENYQQAIILNTHYTGANMALVTIFSETEGLKKGIVKIAKKRQAELQKGNIIEYVHFKRKDDQLGTFRFNLLEQTFIKYFDNLQAMKSLDYIVKLLMKFLKEDIPHPEIYDDTILAFEQLELNQSNEFILNLFEFNIIKHLGYGLDTHNILTVDDNDNSPAFYLSPKSLRVVSENLGKPYKDKLLVLPKILGGIVTEDQSKLLQEINKLLLKKISQL